MSKDRKTQTAYRSAVSGQFETKKEAERHPDRSIKERNPVGHKPSKSKGR